MRSQALFDEPTAAPAGPQRQALEPPDVLIIEEHVADCDDALIDLVRVAGEDDTLGNDTVEGRGEGGVSGDEFERRGGGRGSRLYIGVGIRGWRCGTLEI